MSEPADLSRPGSIEALTQMLYDAAALCGMDADTLKQQEQDDRVWRIAQEELREAADRIKQRTAGLPSTLRASSEEEAYQEVRGVDPAPRAGRVKAAGPSSTPGS